MGFPLSEWIETHAGLPHSMGASGLVGSLESSARILRGPRRSKPDPRALAARVAERLGVPVHRLFLTHGATEGNALVQFFLAERIRREAGHAPRARIHRPEYPPLGDVAEAAGYRVLPGGRPADLWIRSEPHNPSGMLAGRVERERLGADCPRWLIDETFREITPAESLAAVARPGTWVTGTFTKVFGADEVRVGWIAPPEEEAAPFARFHPLACDGLPADSTRAALDLIEASDEILSEARELFERNRQALDRRLPRLAGVRGPVAFDRPGPPDTGPVTERCLAAGVLVCPGHFFGDPSGVRLGLTRRDFPASLSAYWAVRGSDDPITPAGGPGARRRRLGAPKGAARSGRSVRERPVPPAP